MRIFETHAHLDFKNYDKDRDKLLKNCFKAGVEYIINIGVDEETSKNSIKMAEKYDEVYASIGYHPSTVNQYNENVLKKLHKHPKVVAIGEIGLDYYRNYNPKKMQLDVFEKQLILGKELNKPFIIHDRDAHEDCLQMMKKHNIKDAVFHCFSGDEVFAEKVLQEGWYISFTGTITYKTSKLDNVIRMIPAEKFFIETDAPYLTPVPFRGKRNSPEYLRYVIEKIADIKRIPPKMVAEQSFINAYNFFLKK